MIRYNLNKADKSHLLEKRRYSLTWLLELRYASEELKKDRDVQEAIRQYLIDRCDKKFITPDDLHYVGAELQNDKELVLYLAAQNGCVLKYASAELQNDKEVALVAVKKSGRALRYVSDELKNDKEVVFTAVLKSASALQYASESLKSDVSFMRMIVRHKPATVKYLSEELKEDEEINQIIKLANDSKKPSSVSETPKDHGDIKLPIDELASLTPKESAAITELLLDDNVESNIAKINRQIAILTLLKKELEELRTNKTGSNDIPSNDNHFKL